MKNDIALNKPQDNKFIILILGDSEEDKQKFVEKYLKSSKIDFTKEEKTFFISYLYSLPSSATLPEINFEIRILNSGEIDTELKIHKIFFAGAMGAFIMTSILDDNSFCK